MATSFPQGRDGSYESEQSNVRKTTEKRYTLPRRVVWMIRKSCGTENIFEAASGVDDTNVLWWTEKG